MELEYLKKSIVEPCGFSITNLEAALESKEYAAHNFMLNECNVQYREGKITPTKTGLFVTLWKRDNNGITAPFDGSDSLDYCIIAARKEANIGFFIFSKAALLEHKILSNLTTVGKRGFRIYPPWEVTTSKQAEKTQQWQRQYFINLSYPNSFAVSQALKLLR